MKKFYFFSMFVMMFSVVTCLSSCSEDDGTDPSDVSEGLVSETLPTKKGWDGSMENGVCTYTPNEVDADAYFAFSFKNGKCDDAVLNLLFYSEAEAKEAADLLNNGTFDDLEAWDEGEYSYSDLAMAKALNQVKLIKNAIVKNQPASRADKIGVSCTQQGKAVFFKIDCLKGKDGETVKLVVEAWYESDIEASKIPEEPIFGTYDSTTGTYTLNDVMGLKESKYEIIIGFESDMVKSVKTVVTLPNASWAEYMEEDIRGQADEFWELYGSQVTINREGNKITLEANVSSSEISRTEIMKFIVAVDIMFCTPAGLMI